MTILETVLEALKKITPADVAQSMLSFGPREEGEHVYGIVESDEARRMWALAHRYEGEARMYAFSCKYDSKTVEERDAFGKLHAVAHALEEIARDLAWAEIRNELDAWHADRMALREGFTLVEVVATEPSLQAALVPLGNLPTEILRALRDAAKAAQEEKALKERKPS